VRSIVGPVFAHRLVLTPEAELRGETVGHIIDRVLAQVPVPIGLVERGGRTDGREPG
jgi:MoxR-like ATPase